MCIGDDPSPALDHWLIYSPRTAAYRLADTNL